MTTVADLPASGLGSLRRAGLLLLAAGAVLTLVPATHPAAHHVDGGSMLRLAASTTAR